MQEVKTVRDDLVHEVLITPEQENKQEWKKKKRMRE